MLQRNMYVVVVVVVLDVTTIPVYVGAPNSKKCEPGDKSAIYVYDFESPNTLADHLLYPCYHRTKKLTILLISNGNRNL